MGKLTKRQSQIAKNIDFYGWIESVEDRTLKSLRSKGIVASEPIPSSAIRLRWTITNEGRAALKSEERRVMARERAGPVSVALVDGVRKLS